MYSCLLTKTLRFRKFINLIKMTENVTGRPEASLYTSSSERKSLIAVCQMTVTNCKETNFKINRNLIEGAAANGAKMIFLPECFDLIGTSIEDTLSQAEYLNGPFMSDMLNLAKQNCIWISMGGFHLRTEAKKISNVHVICNSEGEIVSTYNKIHLFDMEKAKLKESDFVMAGNKIIPPVSTPIGKIGMGICYDLRFPEFATSLTKMGAEILTYPSAFTVNTGMAHWEPLLRARAIENQTYVIAAAQVGKHNEKRTTYGHAMVVDPWGCVIAQCSQTNQFVLAEVDLNYVQQVRMQMPVSQHRKPNLYFNLIPIEIEDVNYQFGKVVLTGDQLFLRTNLTMAFVNIKPVLPGHVLISPLRVAVRLSDLTNSEITDLFLTVQKVQGVVEKAFNTTSSTVVLQDGPDAGQSIDHVHVHILPRREKDFERNDDIYLALQNEKKEDKFRSLEEMKNEALILREYFKT